LLVLPGALLGLDLVGAVPYLGVADGVVADGAAGALLGLDLVGAVGALLGLHLVGAAGAFLGGLNLFVLAAGVLLVAGVEELAGAKLAFPASVGACCQRKKRNDK
jgi:hypothetical protein